MSERCPAFRPLDVPHNYVLNRDGDTFVFVCRWCGKRVDREGAA